MKLGVTLDILNQKATPAFYADTLANRPAAGFTGRVFISTDTYDLYRDTGTAWVLLSPANTGTITGGGSLYRVGIWTSTTNLGESNNLVFDYSTNRLGINTNAPTASLDVHGTTNVIAQLNQLTTGQNALLTFQDNSVGKWRLGNIYNAAANDFGIVDILNSLQRFTIKNTGQTFIGTETTSSGLLVVNSSTADNQIVAIGANAPSIRINNGSAAKQVGIGISTATNNFIQGSADRDFCIFNGSTTAASPMLFGIYDTGLTNVQEAARFSAARNFLVGKVTDSGEKFQVSGSSSLGGVISNTIPLNSTTNLATPITNTVGSVNTIHFDLLNSSHRFSIIRNNSGNRNIVQFTDTNLYFSRGNLDTNGGGINRFEDVLNISTQIYSNNSGTRLGQIRFDVGGGGTSYIFSTNNWGINTATDAGFRLDVNGTARVQGQLVVVNGVASTFSGGITIGGFVNVNGAAQSVAGLNTTRFCAATDAMIGNANAPDASSVLELRNTTKGFLPPRMTTAQKNAIVTPATGLMVYDTTLNKLCVYTGATWETITSV